VRGFEQIAHAGVSNSRQINEAARRRAQNQTDKGPRDPRGLLSAAKFKLETIVEII